jgi:hypothetical protein
MGFCLTLVKLLIHGCHSLVLSLRMFLVLAHLGSAQPQLSRLEIKMMLALIIALITSMLVSCLAIKGGKSVRSTRRNRLKISQMQLKASRSDATGIFRISIPAISDCDYTKKSCYEQVKCKLVIVLSFVTSLIQLVTNLLNKSSSSKRNEHMPQANQAVKSAPAHKETKITEKARIWFLTLWLEFNTLTGIIEKLKMYSAFAGQLEKCPTTGRLHFHVIIEEPNGIRFDTLQKKFPKSDIQAVRKDVAALRYVSKSETAVPEKNPVRFKHGEFTFEKATAQVIPKLCFADFHQMVMNGNKVDILIQQYPEALWHEKKLRELEAVLLSDKWQNATRELTVEYIWGVSGAGKTHYVYEKYDFDKSKVFVVSDYKNPFDNYKGQEALVLDEFHSNSSNISFPYLLKLADKWPVELSARYNNKFAAYKNLYIISNEALESQYPEIQADKPDSWQALLRRIGGNITYMGTPHESVTKHTEKKSAPKKQTKRSTKKV